MDVPEYLGPYEIGKMIGKGGMGAVYEAVHAKTGQAVAVKLLIGAFADEKRFRRRFAEEIESLIQMNHPNIVRVFAFGEEDGRLFYSMERIDGPSLQQHLRMARRLDWSETLDVMIPITEALQYAHNFGCLHRDLKPANILLAKDGPAKLLDFGIARSWRIDGDNLRPIAEMQLDDTRGERPNDDGTVIGTADFMSPEQARGRRVTTSSDLYAVGGVMFACLAGRTPFRGRELTEVLNAVKNETPPPLAMVAPETPIELCELVDELLQKDPNLRPKNARLLLNRLRSIQLGLSREQTPSATPTVSDISFNDGDSTGFDTNTDLPAASETGEDYELQERKTNSDGILSHDDDPTMQSRAGQPTPPPVVNPQTNSDAAAPGQLPNAVTVNPDHQRVARPSDKTHRKSSLATAATRDGIEDEPHPQTQPMGDVAFRSPPPRRTSFHVVEDDQRGRLESYAQDSNNWISNLSTALLGLILVGICGFVIYMLQPPSADTLYTQIIDAESAGNLTSQRSNMQRFLEQFPDDPRNDEVESFLAAISVDRVVRQLKTRAAMSGGVSGLGPARAAFLTAMQLREEDPVAAAQRLQNFLVVFDRPGAPISRQTKQLIPAARAELRILEADRLENDAQQDSDSDSARIKTMLTWAEKNLNEQELQSYRDSLRSLYSDTIWADAVK
ncbi:MAG: serine/threonine-protein kinase [Planctomycetota bacterium]